MDFIGSKLANVTLTEYCPAHNQNDVERAGVLFVSDASAEKLTLFEPCQAMNTSTDFSVVRASFNFMLLFAVYFTCSRLVITLG